MKHYNDWLIVFQKLNENPSLSTIQEAKKLQASMGEELWEQYIGLLLCEEQRMQDYCQIWCIVL